MCGIVGFTGTRQAAPILLDGLSKLEYRGYDSAGMAVRDGENLAQVVKAKGRLSNLMEKTDNGNALKGTCGIGHTRWATHGEPSQTNAHPHVSGNCTRSGSGAVESEVVGVHNGIIENYTELKEKLLTDIFVIYQINDAEKNREYRCRSYAYQIEHGFMITTDNYEISYCGKASQGLVPAKIRENMESLNPDKFKIRKFGVSDVIAITAAGKTAFYYVDKEALVKFNGLLAPKTEGSYLILNEGGYQIEGQTDTWKVIDEKNVQEQRFVQLVCEQTKKQRPDIILHDSGVLMAQTIYGFDSSVMKKIEKFLREQKPELLHHQKFLENGTAERAKESGTEQNYNMIDGCVNNNPKKPRIIGNRISVLDRLHIKLEERKQKSQPQQLQQQERSRKN